MKMGMVLVGIVAVVLCGGCASTVKKVDPASPRLCRAGVKRGLEAFYTQPRTVDPMVVRPEVVSPEVIQVPAVQ